VSIYIAIGVMVLLILGALAFIATRPDDFRIQRSAQVDASPDAVFSIINEVRRWGEWSPYEKRDPNMKKTFEGPPSGPGASYSWNGNNDVGEGRMTIVQSKPGELVSMKLEFSRPFKCTNEVNFKLAPSDGGTRVSWMMDGKHNIMMKAMSLFMDLDKMVGKDFEDGLANLNCLAQGAKVNAQQGEAARAATPAA
jgi:Polyketide cyclase / dehydrase and lipid transport